MLSSRTSEFFAAGTTPNLLKPPKSAGQRGLQPVRGFDVSLQGRNVFPPLHPHDDLVGIERHMPRYHGEDFFPQPQQEIGLVPAHAALMRQQDLQPLPRNRSRGRRGTAGKKPKHAHAALRPSSRLIRPLRSLGTIMGMVSPSSLFVASA